MNNIIYCGLGAVLGLIFFGGLKLTLQKTAKVKNPALLVILSYLFRMSVLLGGLAFLAAYAGLAALIWGTIGLSMMMLTMIIICHREVTA